MYLKMKKINEQYIREWARKNPGKWLSLDNHPLYHDRNAILIKSDGTIQTDNEQILSNPPEWLVEIQKWIIHESRQKI